ncbi:APC family permease [Actinoplanes sp. NPDC051851]|uniref:APC family permease n=1 Tax=Actinoplanes sp. NPDC051851 TaxID=3154753 RepID=UPI003441C3D1
MTTDHQFRSKVTLAPLVALIFFSVSGGAYGLEPLLSSSGPGIAMILLLVTPLVYSLPVALFTAELSTALPQEGGVYQWVKQGLGSFWGFQEGALFWITSWVDMAVYPVMFADYLARLFGAAEDGATPLFDLGPIHLDLHWLLGVLCVVLPLTLLNIRGARAVGDSALFFIVVAVVPFAILAAWGIPQLFSHHINPVTPLSAPDTSVWGSFAAGLWIVMWNYCGFDSISTVAEEIHNPRKTIPRALFISIGLIVLAYVIPVLGALAAGGWESWDDGSFVDVGQALGGSWLGWLITIGGMASAIGFYSSLLMSNSRIPFILAEDGWVPRVLVRRHRRWGTPVVSIVLCSVIYAIFSMSSFQNLVVVDVFLTNITLLLELAALIALRRKAPGLPRPFRIPGGWAGITLMSVPLVAVILFATVEQFRDEGMTAVWWTVGTVGLALAAYPLAKRHRETSLIAR